MDGLGLLVPPLLVPPLLVPAAVPPIISPGRIAPGKPGFDAHHKLVLFGQNPGRFILYVYMFMYIYIYNCCLMFLRFGSVINQLGPTFQ